MILILLVASVRSFCDRRLAQAVVAVENHDHGASPDQPACDDLHTSAVFFFMLCFNCNYVFKALSDQFGTQSSVSHSYNRLLKTCRRDNAPTDPTLTQNLMPSRPQLEPICAFCLVLLLMFFS